MENCANLAKTHLRFAWRPGTVPPAVAGFNRTGLPLFQLWGTWPSISLRGLDHSSTPPELSYKKHWRKDRYLRCCIAILLKPLVLELCCGWNITLFIFWRLDKCYFKFTLTLEVQHPSFPDACWQRSYSSCALTSRKWLLVWNKGFYCKWIILCYTH